MSGAAPLDGGMKDYVARTSTLLTLDRNIKKPLENI
jgi:hypothetical protein